MLNVNKIKRDFPIFSHHKDLVYLDSTASSLKPKAVIAKLVEYYERYSSNIFRGLYPLSQQATDEYEKTRQLVAEFINAKSPVEIIFTRNTTESLNLIMYTLGEKIIEKGDQIAITIAEHHSDFVPWQQLAIKKQAELLVIGLNEEATLDLKELEEKLSTKTKILAITHISNVLGTINPVSDIVRIARRINPNVIIVLDAAQSIPHLSVDVRELGVDFIAFSGHKMLGPTGVGVLWGKKEYLEQMPPFLFGGEMIDEVTIAKTTFAHLPHKFEAGTPAIGEVIALQEAIKYLQKIGLTNIAAHENELVTYALLRLKEEFPKSITVLGPKSPKHKTGILSFKFNNYHPHDIGEILGSLNICVRVGHHCAAPLHKKQGLIASTRASFYLYNDKNDVEKLILGLHEVEKILKR